MKADDIRQALLNVIRSAFPELAQQTHLPLKAQVLAVTGSAGTVGIENGPRHYSVDVQPLHPDGTPDENRQPLRDVALEMGWPGPGGRGVYHLPEVGSIVRVAFYGGSAGHPYVEGLVPDGFGVPAVLPGEYLVHHSAGVQIRIRPSGEIDVTSDQPIRVVSSSHIDVDAPSIALAGGGPALARVGDEVRVIDPQGGIGIGSITTGSSKVVSG